MDVNLCFKISNIMRLVLSLFIFTLYTLNQLNAQYINWEAKVHPKILEAVQYEKTDCIILMNEQADLSEAKALKTKLEKGNFVYNKLKQTAENTQINVKRILQESQNSYNPFVVVNAIATKLDYNTLMKIALLPEVDRVLYNTKFKVPDIIRTDESLSNPERSTEWGITKINADAVWNLSGYPKGQGVVVAGQDTGYKWDHDAIKSKYKGWNASNSTVDHNYTWHDAIHGNNSHNSGTNPCGYDLTAPCDDHNHGTHTMGTMVGDTANFNIGVAPSAKWIGCRNMERGWGTPTTYTECFNWFLAPTNLSNQNPDPSKSPDVINNSWGCPTDEGCTDTSTYTLMKIAVNSLKSAGVVVVVSAGNDGPNCNTVSSPAAIFANSFTVGATDSNDAIAGFSSRGPSTQYGTIVKPNVTAPGVGVKSCIINGYATWNGTSMAGPHVAGAVALLISAKPSINGNVDAIEDVLELTAAQLTSGQTCGGVSGSSIPNNTFGHGRIDILAAVNEALPVKIVNFYGLKEATQNHLFWKTGLEVNSKKFIIERSSDGFKFTSIGSVNASGYSVSELNYDYIDPISINGTYYYRLKEIDNDGKEDVSKIIVITRNDIQNIQFGPNPTTGELKFAINNDIASFNSLKIYNTSGQLISDFSLNLVKGYNDFTLNIDNLSNGIYRVILSGSNGILLNEKVVLAR